MFSAPKLGPMPAAPPPAPVLPDSMSSTSSQLAQARQAAGAFGMDGTILTSPTGTAAPTTAAKQLFGQ